MTIPRVSWLNGKLVVGLWALTMVVGYFAVGGYLQERVEGIAGNQIPLWPLVVFGILLLDALLATIWWALTLQKRDQDTQAPTDASGRRKFLTGSAAVTGGVIGVVGASAARVSGWATVTGPALAGRVEGTAPNNKAAWRGAQIQAYRPLGSTGLMVSDVAAGSTRLHQNADPVGFLNAMLDRGVNYIDASPDYAPQSEEIIKAAIQGRDRDKLVLATKFCTAHGHLRQGSSVAEYMHAMESALTRLGTDYIDVAHIHSCDSIERLMDESVHEAVDRLREQGKVRFMGVSTHTPNLEAVANTAIDSDRFQVMMLAYHHGAWPHQRDIIKRAAAKGIGIVAMKTLKGAKHNGLKDFSVEADSYAQSAFKWVLSNPDVSNLVISFHNDQHLDEYLHASGAALTANDVAVLEKYDALIAGTHCFAHCGSCLDSCPSDVPINDVLRHRMYFEDYGDQKQAMELYAKLEVNASACIDCDAPCTGACPSNINIHNRMVGAVEMLT
ncbi:MAG: aldo/keto reductase [Pseudomonadota bacterium]